MSDMFEKATKAAKSVGGNVFSSAKNLGNSLYHSTKEQSELASLNVQQSVIEKKLNHYYADIGRRYVEYIDRCEGEVSFEVEDILEQMKPELEKLEEVKVQMAEKEAQIRQSNEEKVRRKARDEFEAKKEKLDKAVSLEIISEEEYQEKLAAAQKKFDNYEILRKIDMQLEMGIISKEEHAEKVKNILC